MTHLVEAVKVRVCINIANLANASVHVTLTGFEETLNAVTLVWRHIRLASPKCLESEGKVSINCHYPKTWKKLVVTTFGLLFHNSPTEIKWHWSVQTASWRHSNWIPKDGQLYNERNEHKVQTARIKTHKEQNPITTVVKNFHAPACKIVK